MIVLHPSALLAAAVADPVSEWVVGQVHQDEVLLPAHATTAVLRRLQGHARAGRLDPHELAEAVEAVVSLPHRAVPPDAGLLEHAGRLRPRCSFSEALHVAVVERHDATLVATDASVVTRCGDADVRTPPRWSWLPA